MRKDINLLFLSLSSSLTLNVLAYLLVLGIIRANRLIGLSNFISIKYLEVVLTVLSTLTSQIFVGFFCSVKLFFCYFSLQISPLFYHGKKICDYFLTN